MTPRRPQSTLEFALSLSPALHLEGRGRSQKPRQISHREKVKAISFLFLCSKPLIASKNTALLLAHHIKSRDPRAK